MPPITDTPHNMAQVLGALDHLDQARQAQADQERADLIQSVTHFCRAQGDEASDQAIARAVDQQLAQPWAPTPPANFGWDRPRTETERASRLAAVTTPTRQRWVSVWRYGNGKLEGLSLFASVWGGFFLSMFVLWLLNDVLHLRDGWALSLTGVLDGVALAWLVPRVRRSRVDLFTAKWLAPWVTKEDEMAAAETLWLAFPSTRRYLQQCFRSEMPTVLEGDAQQLAQLLQQDQRAAEAQRDVQRHGHAMARLSQAVLAPTGSEPLHA